LKTNGHLDEIGGHDSFAHLCRRIFVGPYDLMAMTLYCDDSGTHVKSPWAVAACLVAPVEQWQRFNEDWESVKREEGFEVFHMNRFVAKKPPFDSPQWEDQEKRDRTVRKLVGIITNRCSRAFVSAVKKSAYDEFSLRFSNTGGCLLGDNHYTFAVLLSLTLLSVWREENGHDNSELVDFVFDNMSEGKCEINNLFEGFFGNGDHFARNRYGAFHNGWGFRDKRYVMPLQAADIVAWESFHHVHNESFRKSRIELESKLGYTCRRFERADSSKFFTDVRERLIKYMEELGRSREGK
jgi:hypothetical protein